ncbi:MAG: P27 family phage terminase small subunit [Thermodesulfobacteriota bacterium]
MPARLPDELKRLKGTLRPCRVKKNTPKGVPGVVPCSRELNSLVRREYKKLSTLLIGMGVLSEGDSGELESLAIARVQIRYAQNELFRQTERKSFRQWQIILNDSIRLSANLSARFGLSPVDRGRVSVVQESSPKPNRWDPRSNFQWEAYKK